MHEAPRGSRIQIEMAPDGSTIFKWRKPDGGPLRFVVAAALTVWLGGWAFGLLSASRELVRGTKQTGFLIFWLLMWVMGGSFAIAYVYLLLRPPKPEKLTLAGDHAEYDTGTTTPISMMRGRDYTFNQYARMKKLFARRKIFPRLERVSTKFVHESNPSRIYFDQDSQRHEIASGLSEPDIDWLYGKIEAWSRR